MNRLFGSEQPVGLLELVQLLATGLLPFVDLALVTQSILLLLLLLTLQLLQDHAALLLLWGYLVQEPSLLGLVTLELLSLPAFLLLLMLLHPALHLGPVLFLDPEVLFLFCLVLLHLAFPVIVDLVEQVDPALLSFLPVLLLFFLLLQPLALDQPV